MKKNQMLAHPKEVRRMKWVMGCVVLVGISVVAVAMYFGNAPRPTVDRLNLVLGPIVVLLLATTFHAMIRYRKAINVWKKEDHVQ